MHAVDWKAPLPTIWIVDDSPLDAELTRRALAPLYRIEVFTDGAAVLEHFACARPPDAIILDWHMPGISGLEICQFLRSHAQTQALPILMLTVQHDTHDLVKCLAAGADDFLSKPYNQAELSARIAALLRSKGLHERVQAAERAVRSLLMQLPDAVMTIDASTRVSFVNLEAERMLARGAATLVGKPLREVLPEYSFEGSLARGHDAVPLPDLVLGDRVFAPAVRSFAGVDETETTLSFREVTSERRHQHERARLLEAEQAARTQAELASRAKDEFLAIVSHELRTPLNAILGWTRMLRGGALDDEKRSRALETVERNAAAQQKLIEDILDVSRITAGKLQIDMAPVALAATVRAAVDAVRLAADAKGIKLNVETTAEPVVSGDADRLTQIALNLLNNAVKFTPAGGSVSVAVGVEDRSAVLQICDSGEGIQAGFLPYLFDRFRQAESGTTRAHGGLGLGLSIVRHLVERHGGTVTAASDGPGTGSTFRVTIPLEPAARTRRASEPEPAPDSNECPTRQSVVNGGRSLDEIRVLVVDDDPDTRELITEMLASQGALATAVPSVVHALRAVQAFRPQVIVSDIGMPNDDGYLLVKRLRHLDTAEGGETPVVALTAFAGPHDRAQALAAGFDAYVSKPVEASELVAIVASLAEEG